MYTRHEITRAKQWHTPIRAILNSHDPVCEAIAVDYLERLLIETLYVLQLRAAWSDDLVENFVATLFRQFPDSCLEDWVMFFDGVRAARFGPHYGRLDQAMLFGWFSNEDPEDPGFIQKIGKKITRYWQTAEYRIWEDGQKKLKQAQNG